MITKTDALEIVSQALRKMSTSEDPFVVVEKSTIDRPFGWVFFYNSKKFVETGALRYRLAGNGPVIVSKDTGAVEFFGSNRPVQELVDDYETRAAERNKK